MLSTVEYSSALTPCVPFKSPYCYIGRNLMLSSMKAIETNLVEEQGEHGEMGDMGDYIGAISVNCY